MYDHISSLFLYCLIVSTAIQILHYQSEVRCSREIDLSFINSYNWEATLELAFISTILISKLPSVKMMMSKI